MNSNRRILELALSGLEAERDRIEKEIIEIEKQLGKRKRQEISYNAPRQVRLGKRRLSAAGRKAISDAMKKRWASHKKLLGRN
jgi:hypothetical protein